MSDRDELAALRRMAELEAKAGAAPESVATAAPQKASLGDKIIGSEMGRFALGAASPIIGAAQLMAHAPTGPFGNPLHGAMRDIGPEKMDAFVNYLDAAKRRGMGKDGPDVAGLGGSLVSGGAATKGIPVAAGLLGKMGQGAALGAAFGATAPVVGETEDYGKSKAMQTAVGAGTGGLIPPAIAAASKIGGGIRNVWDVVGGTKSGIERIKRAYYERLVGKDNVPSVIQSLKGADGIIPGGKATVAEAVSNNPAGTSLQAQQAATAGTSGGVSADFNRRLYAQEVARKSAGMERDAVTDKMREAALASATNINPVALETDILKIVAHPEIQAVTPARNLLQKVQGDVVAAAKSGDANALYATRKYIGDLIDGKVESEQNVAKSLQPRLIEMKGAIDKAIEDGGAGNLWPAYLKEFSTRSKAIKDSTERAAEMYKPAQRTAISGGDNVSEHTATKLPNLLSREAMIANWVAKVARGRVEPKIDASMAQDFLDPKLMASVMEKSTPAQRKILSDAIARYSRVGGPTVAVQEQR